MAEWYAAAIRADVTIYGLRVFTRSDGWKGGSGTEAGREEGGERPAGRGEDGGTGRKEEGQEGGRRREGKDEAGRKKGRWGMDRKEQSKGKQSSGV